MENQIEIFEAFVSMPFGPPDSEARRYWNDFYNALADTRPLLSTKNFQINFTRADIGMGHLELKESVSTLLRRSHLAVAVITGLNPNVFWEVGFAECLSLPVIFLVAKNAKEAETSPVLVSATLRLPYDGTVFDMTPPDAHRVGDFQRSLLLYLSTAVAIVRGKAEQPPRYIVYPDRKGASLPEIIASAEHSIDLITSNLSYFSALESFYIIRKGERIFPFDIPIERGVKVRILSLDPDSAIAAYRAKQLNRVHDVSGYREELRQSARFFYQRYQHKRNVDIRIFDDLPLQITMIVDNKVVTSVMSRGNQSRDNIHLQFDLDFRGAHATFERHFAEVLANQAQTSHIGNMAWAHGPGKPRAATEASD